MAIADKRTAQRMGVQMLGRGGVGATAGVSGREFAGVGGERGTGEWGGSGSDSLDTMAKRVTTVDLDKLRKACDDAESVDGFVAALRARLGRSSGGDPFVPQGGGGVAGGFAGSGAGVGGGEEKLIESKAGGGGWRGPLAVPTSVLYPDAGKQQQKKKTKKKAGKDAGADEKENANANENESTAGKETEAAVTDGGWAMLCGEDQSRKDIERDCLVLNGPNGLIVPGTLGYARVVGTLSGVIQRQQAMVSPAAAASLAKGLLRCAR